MLKKGVFNSMTIEYVCLQEGTTSKNNVIRSHCNEIYTEEINIISLSSDDDKRVIMADVIHTVAYGHTKLKQLQLKNELQ